MTTEERFEKLERELSCAKRRNRWLLAGVGLIVVGLGLAWTLTKTTPAAQAQGVGGKAEKIIRANKFILSDKKGQPRAELGFFMGDPELRLFGKKRGLLSGRGLTRVRLALHKGDPMLCLSDEKGMLRAGLVLYSHGSSLTLYDEKGEGRASLGVLSLKLKMKKYVSASLHLHDEKGNLGASLSMPPGGPRLILFGDKSVQRVSLYAGKDRSELSLNDEKGKTRFWLDVRKDRTALSLWDEKNKLVWFAPR